MHTHRPTHKHKIQKPTVEIIFDSFKNYILVNIIQVYKIWGIESILEITPRHKEKTNDLI